MSAFDCFRKALLTTSSVSYADFVIVGMLHFFKVIDESIYDRVIKTEPECGKLYDACKPWLERDGH